MLPYLAYKYVKDQKEKNRRDMQDSLANLTVNLSKSISPDMVRFIIIKDLMINGKSLAQFRNIS